MESEDSPRIRPIHSPFVSLLAVPFFASECLLSHVQVYGDGTKLDVAAGAKVLGLAAEKVNFPASPSCDTGIKVGR